MLLVARLVKAFGLVVTSLVVVVPMLLEADLFVVELVRLFVGAMLSFLRFAVASGVWG